MRYLKNAWYVAAIGHEVRAGEMLVRKLFDTNLVFWRSGDGRPVAMLDRCPHRFAPLRMGRVEGDDEDGERVKTAWEWTQEPPMGLFNDFLPQPGAAARHFVTVTWRAPCNMVVHVGATQGGNGYDQALDSRDHHMMTPETEFSTHYFMVSRRNYMVDSAEYNEGKINGMMQAFLEEDAPVVAAIQKEMGEKTIDEMAPAYLSGDRGPVRCRRHLAKLIAGEAKA